MNKKERTIKAIEILIDLYKYHHNHLAPCPLCIIHFNYKSGRNNCYGCPNKIFGHHFRPCVHSKTFDNIQNRIKFWQQALPKLKKLSPEAFTKKGYKDKYFEFLIELDNKIAENHDKNRKHIKVSRQQ